MTKIYSHLPDPEVYGIYDGRKDILIISTNPAARKGIIVLLGESR